MPIIKMPYVMEDEEGKEIINLLESNDVDCKVFTCTEQERKMYDFPSLLTTAGNYAGRKAIEHYVERHEFYDQLQLEMDERAKELLNS